MSDNDEKILPILRWLLIAFFGLLLVLALQLFLLVTRADASTTTIRVGYPQLNGGQTPLWNIPENKIDRQYGIEINPVYIPGGVRLTQSAVSGSVDVELTGGAAVNAMLSGANLIYVGMPVPTYAFSIYARPEIREVPDLRGKVLGVKSTGFVKELYRGPLENPKAGILQSFGCGGRWNDCVQNILFFHFVSVPLISKPLLRG
jgi:ABC-type nitrate/sulfonate/bicarbonate transport system substrate-binding protein